MKLTNHSTDQELIKACIRQDRRGQQLLYQRYYGKLLGICMRYTGHKEEATDVLNRAFFKIFQKLDQYKETGPFGGWLSKIVFHTAIDYVRTQAKYREVIDYNSEKEMEINPEVIDQLYAEDLYKAIQELPIHARTVFSLYVVDGYKHREIGELLKISEQTSKYHLAAARKTLQQKLSQYNPNRIRI